MSNEELVQTVRELAIRLSNAEIDRASFKAQATTLTNENDQLKKQVEELKAKLSNEDDKKTDSKSQITEPETKQDPQAK